MRLTLKYDPLTNSITPTVILTEEYLAERLGATIASKLSLDLAIRPLDGPEIPVAQFLETLGINGTPEAR